MKKKAAQQDIEAKQDILPSQQDTPSGFPAWINRPLMHYLSIVLMAVLAFGSILSNDFTYFDDDQAILYNHALKNPSLSSIFTSENLGMYAPITWISYLATNKLFGNGAFGFHFMSLLVHLITCILLYHVLYQIAQHWLSQLPNSRLFAWCVTLIFAVHPIQTEAIAWAAAHSTVLFSCFYLASLLIWLKWLDNQRSTNYLISLSLFLLAVLSKSAAVTLPLVFLFLLFTSDKYLLRKHWKSTLPYFALSLVFGVYTFITRAHEGHEVLSTQQKYSFFDRILMASQTLGFYIQKALIPFGYSISYPFLKTNGSWPIVYYIAPVLVAAAAWFIIKRADKPVKIAAGLYFLPLVVMLPFQTVGTFELRMDRYAYLSLAGILFGLVWLAYQFLPKWWPYLSMGLAIALVPLSKMQSNVWKSGISLFSHCVETTPESALCNCNLAYNELLSLKFEDCIKHYSMALSVDTSYVEAYNGRGQAYLETKKFDLALADFDQAIKANMSSPRLFMNRAKCLLALGRSADAKQPLLKSLSLAQDLPDTWYLLGTVYEKENRPDSAMLAYNRAIALKSDFIEPLVNRGTLQVATKDYAGAIESFSKVIAINPKLGMALNNRAIALMESGKIDAALMDANAALALNPNYARALTTRMKIYQLKGMQEEAQKDLERLLGQNQ